MSDESINKFLCGKVERKCWHEFAHTIYKEPLESYKRCVKCGEQWRSGKHGFWPDISTIPPFNPDYLHSCDDYLRLMQAAMKEAWWENFVWTVPATWLDTLEIFVTPSRGARALAEFLGWEEEGNG